MTRIKNDTEVRCAVLLWPNCRRLFFPAPIFTEEHTDELTLLVDSVVEAKIDFIRDKGSYREIGFCHAASSCDGAGEQAVQVRFENVWKISYAG